LVKLTRRDRLARLRRERGICCQQQRTFKATTPSNHDLPVAENRPGQGFEATAPNEVWHPDITYLPTGEGWLSLAGIKDQFTGEIVGYAMDARMTQELVGQALWRAISYQRPAPYLVAGGVKCIPIKILNRFLMAKPISPIGSSPLSAVP